MPLEDRFWPQVAETDGVSSAGWSGCWVWTGTTDPHGYARIRLGNLAAGRDGVHRVAWRLVVGVIPEGLVLDHLCERPLCCNPAHMIVVTRTANTMRGVSPHAMNARKTHCPRGHAFAGRNLYVNPLGQRVCRSCKREKAREARARKRGVSC